MADIRIKDLATTATSSASDDYLALDGSTNGTRKILATNVANNVTDVIFGTSGPSAKSSIAARAARQGLVFDGTSGATVSVPAFGTAAYSVAAWVNPSALPAAQVAIFGGTTNSSSLFLKSNGTLVTSKVGVADVTPSTGTVTARKFSLVVYIRTGTTGTYYIDGIAAGTTTDSNDYSVATTLIGAASISSTYVWSGNLSVAIYNRALSAAEVVSLYESGVPAGSDYNNAGTTDIKPSAGTYAFWFGTGSISAATASSFTIAAGASSLAVRNVSGTFSAVTGKRYRATIVASGLTSAADFGSQGFTSNLSSGNISNGTNVIEFTATSTASGYFAISTISSTAGGSISISSIQALGLLLAPDAAQSGGGLTWYDTSGNAANITLPATGVSWNVPTSGYLTSSSSLNLNAGGTNQSITLTPTGTGTNVLTSNSVGVSATIQNGAAIRSGTVGGALYADVGRLIIRDGNGTGGGGRLFIGTVTDSGALLQIGTNTVAQTGGMVFGTDTFLYREAAGTLNVSGTANAFVYAEGAAGASQGFLIKQAGSFVAGMRVAASTSLLLTSGNNTTALTLDSSQNATFAKAVTGALITSQANDTSSGIVVKRSANPYIDFYDGGTSGTIRAEISATNDGVNGGTLVFAPRNAAGSITTAMTLTKDLAATFAGAVNVGGALKLGNAYVAGAVVGTGYVTIQDSTGTTYRVPVLV